MFIEIESKNKKAEIKNIEFEKNKITFFLSDFFYIIFEKEEEREKFNSEILKHFGENYEEGISYVEIENSLINAYDNWNNFILQDITKLIVQSYKIVNCQNHLEINFTSGKEDLKFILYKQILIKIKDNMKYMK